MAVRFMRESMSEKSIFVFRIRYTLFSMVMTFLLGLVGVMNFHFYIFILILYYIFFIFLILLYSPLKHKKFSYTIISNCLKISCGVFFIKNITVGIDKIQYVETHQSIEQRFFSLCTLIFYTAGGKVKIPQIDTKKALSIKKQLYRSFKNEET